MELNPQIIKIGNSIEFAVLPYKEFLKMREMLEDYEDLLELRKAKEIDLHKPSKSVSSILHQLESIS